MVRHCRPDRCLLGCFEPSDEPDGARDVTIICGRREATAMRQVLTGIAVLMLGGVAFAQDYTSSEYCDPWCVRGRGDGLDCSYHTFQQCLATASGMGSHCTENPFLPLCRRPLAASPSRRHAR
jgi:hypothetical protein